MSSCLGRIIIHCLFLSSAFLGVSASADTCLVENVVLKCDFDKSGDNFRLFVEQHFNGHVIYYARILKNPKSEKMLESDAFLNSSSFPTFNNNIVGSLPWGDITVENESCGDEVTTGDGPYKQYETTCSAKLKNEVYGWNDKAGAPYPDPEKVESYHAICKSYRSRLPSQHFFSPGNCNNGRKN